MQNNFVKHLEEGMEEEDEIEEEYDDYESDS